MTAEAWPTGVRVRSVQPRLEAMSRSGGVATNGMEQVIVSGAGRWAISITAIVGAAQLMAWRAFLARLQGRAGTVLVPVYDFPRVPWPVDAWGRQLTPDFVREKELDGTDYEDDEVPSESAIVATLGAAAAQAATSIVVNVSQGEPVEVGHYLSIASRLYLATAVSGTTVTIQPPLRAAALSGASVELRNPVCEMRLAADDAGAIAVDRAPVWFPVLDFVEAF